MLVRKYVVVPPMEGELEKLREMAGNLWFSWNTEAVELFHHLDEDLWERSNHNPQQSLIGLSSRRLVQIREDEGYRSHVNKVYRLFKTYIERPRRYDFHLEHPVDFTTAYFSLEYGLTESLTIYSGGLGVLAGDHLKSASDLSLPLVAVGLMYQSGYFIQRLSAEGWQQEAYTVVELDTLPLEEMSHHDGAPLRISVDLGGETLFARVLRVRVGRIDLYLLDANISENPPSLRATTARLYGGDQEMRIRQEILLGMGGSRALEAMGIEPSVYHLNEGHAAFTLLERLRYYVEEQRLSVDEAREMVTGQSVLTLHTPVPAGNDVFDRGLMEKYFKDFCSRLGIDFNVFMGWGRQDPLDPHEGFCMPVLGLRMSARANGVSKLHGVVAREMWRRVWPSADPEDIPIIPITNGVHIPSYISRDLSKAYDRYLGPGWNEDPDNDKIWRRAEDIPASELWRTHEWCRARLVRFARRRLAEQLTRRGASNSALERAQSVLDPETLTICFARRFATYKRAALLFKEPDRLARIIGHPDRPIQVIFAGKAHPADDQGKALIRGIIELIEKEPFRGKVVFIEDYDLNVARYMVQGADVWLNTPRRPLEACGTSGMKAAANGALNLSVLDGWWDEAYDGHNGWAIGLREEYEDLEHQDYVESRALYDLLEESVKPLFYERGLDDLPREWIRMMKRSIGTVCPVFNAHRMVTDYVERFYIPSAVTSSRLKEDNYATLRAMVAWKAEVRKNWERMSVTDIQVENEDSAKKGRSIEVAVTINTAGMSAEDLRVDLIHGPVDLWDNFLARQITRLTPTEEATSGTVRFSGLMPLKQTGAHGYQVRITPDHPTLAFSDRYTLVRTV